MGGDQGFIGGSQQDCRPARVINMNYISKIIHTIVRKQNSDASYVTIKETDSVLEGVRCFHALYLSNSNVNKLEILLDTATLRLVASYLSFLHSPGAGVNP